MTETDRSLSRRQFMLVAGSAVVSALTGGAIVDAVNDTTYENSEKSKRENIFGDMVASQITREEAETLLANIKGGVESFSYPTIVELTLEAARYPKNYGENHNTEAIPLFVYFPNGSGIKLGSRIDPNEGVDLLRADKSGANYESWELLTDENEKPYQSLSMEANKKIAKYIADGIRAIWKVESHGWTEIDEDPQKTIFIYIPTSQPGGKGEMVLPRMGEVEQEITFVMGISHQIYVGPNGRDSASVGKDIIEQSAWTNRGTNPGEYTFFKVNIVKS